MHCLYPSPEIRVDRRNHCKHLWRKLNIKRKANLRAGASGFKRFWPFASMDQAQTAINIVAIHNPRLTDAAADSTATGHSGPFPGVIGEVTTTIRSAAGILDLSERRTQYLAQHGQLGKLRTPTPKEQAQYNLPGNAIVLDGDKVRQLKAKRKAAGL